MVSVMSLVWSQESLCIMGSLASLGQPPQVWVRRWSTVMSVTHCL